MHEASALAIQSAAVRRFNRFYTRRIGVLDETLLESPFSLTEVRVLYEIAHRDRPTATEIREELGLDRGYLSRLLAGLARAGLVRRRQSARDGRESLLSLTAAGRKSLQEERAQWQRYAGAVAMVLES